MMVGRKAKRGRAYIGTSGWSYGHWSKGRFYPVGLKSTDWLRFYAQFFNTVEINASFYRLPKPGVGAKWRETVPAEFRFAVKLWRWITHQRKLTNPADDLEKFFGFANELGEKRGPILVQLPPAWKRNLDRLDEFLIELRRAVADTPWLVAVEFRNQSWLSEETCDLLDRHGVALCLADMERCPTTRPNDAPLVYVRRHGPSGPYQGCYAPEHIQADAAEIRKWLDAGRDVYVYYNNDVGGHAVDNARQLIEQL